jgi:hypothetical protein
MSDETETADEPTLALTIEDQIAHFEARGVITLDAIKRIFDRLHTSLAAGLPAIAGALAIYNKCEFRMSAADMSDLYRLNQSYGLNVKMPTAIVVSEEMLEQMRVYVDAQVESGIPRAVFTDKETALQWVTRQAALISTVR